MAMTLEQAKALRRGDILHHDRHTNRDGSCQRWKVSGQPKTWKRDASRVKVPVKFGIYASDYVTENELHLVHLEAECPR